MKYLYKVSKQYYSFIEEIKSYTYAQSMRDRCVKFPLIPVETSSLASALRLRESYVFAFRFIRNKCETIELFKSKDGF